jgi:ParB family chromosome partitioning protein
MLQQIAIKDSVIERLSRASEMLVEAKSMQEVKKIMDVAGAAKIYARRQQLGEEAVQHARSIELEAMRRLGELLAETPKNKGINGTKLIGSKQEPVRDSTPTLSDLGVDKKISSLSQQLARMPKKEFEQVRDGVVSMSEALKIAHVSHNSGENEWYTPAAYIEAARAVMGGIDTDPASCAQANATVKADKYYDSKADGLTKKWHGRVFMNPPYAQPLIANFARAVAAKFSNKEITEAIVLVNNATETEWFHEMIKHASAVCFPNGRIRFVNKEGKPGGAPLQGQAVLYFGSKIQKFISEFKSFGWIGRIADE